VYILTKLGNKVYILLFNSVKKFHIKNLHALLKYQRKLQGLIFYWTTLYDCMTVYHELE